MASVYSNRKILPKHRGFINVNTPERIASAAFGAYLFYSGLNNLFSSPLRSIVRTIAGGCLISRGISGNCPVYQQLEWDSTQTPAINIQCNFKVNKPRNEVYSSWRTLSNLPIFMKHLERVEELNATTSHWTVSIPGNTGKISFNAEIVKEDEGNLIGWRSIAGSLINHAGKVEFFDADGGTELHVVLSYHSPIGSIGTTLAKLLNPTFEKMISEDIYAFKRFIENTDNARFAHKLNMSAN